MRENLHFPDRDNAELTPSDTMPIAKTEEPVIKEVKKEEVVKEVKKEEVVDLANIAKVHNSSVDKKNQKTSTKTLSLILKRGNIKRVESYLNALKTNHFEGEAHDFDLFPKGHPLKT
jgi:hypothetical protein